MKQYSMLIFLGILIISGITAQTLRGSTMYVAVKSVPLKSSTEFLARDQGTLIYGNQVKVLQEKGKWVEVQAAAQPTLKGWMSSTGLTSKRIISSGGSTSASVSELALAGKGFSEETEQAYKKDDELDYTNVDAMEAYSISNQELYGFLIEGRLQLARER